jgi:uncharacterized protein with HEPN domain
VHVAVPQEQIQAFCHKWKIREFGPVVLDAPHSRDGLRVRVDFEAKADHSLVDHVRLEREAGVLFGRPVRVIENAALGHPLHGLPEEQADADLSYVLLMRRALEELVLHVVGLRCETYEHVQSLQDSTLRQLVVLAELAARVSPSFRSAHPEVPWADLAGLRALLIQPYLRVTAARAWQTISRDCPGLGAALDRIAGINPAGGESYDVNRSFSGWGVRSDPGYR